MGFGLRLALIVFAATSGSLAGSIAWAGDDGAAPLWEGIGSIFGPVFGLGGGDKKDPIDYREHGKIVVPPKMDLPPPGSASSGDPAWPVNQEVQRKKLQKEAAKQPIAGVGDARLRYTQPFPNAPVTVHTTDQDLAGANGASGNAASAVSPLGNLNPLNWVGMGKTVPLGPEPDREWLTDPPQGFRAPAGPVAGSAAN
jgi:hypothetical protein